MSNANKPLSGLGMIVNERTEQIFKHGFTIETNSKYSERSVFTRAAIAIIHQAKREWPEHDIPISIYYKIMTKTRIQQYACAGAFLAACIDYLQIGSLNNLDTDVVNEMLKPINTEMAALHIIATQPLSMNRIAIENAGIKMNDYYELEQAHTFGSDKIVFKDKQAINTEGTPEFNEAVYIDTIVTTIKELVDAIIVTASGELRNLLCDCNIHLQTLLNTLNLSKQKSIQELYNEYMIYFADQSEYNPLLFQSWLKAGGYLKLQQA